MHLQGTLEILRPLTHRPIFRRSRVFVFALSHTRMRACGLIVHEN